MTGEGRASSLAVAFLCFLGFCCRGCCDYAPLGKWRGADGGEGGKGKQLEQIRGFSIQLTDPKGRDSDLKAVDDLADMGCTWVNFVIKAVAEDVKFEVIMINWKNIPPEWDISRIIRHAKAHICR